MGNTKIPWATKNWGPIVGCTNELQCFARCYARRLSKRFAANPQFSAEYRERYAKSFTVGPQLFPERLDEPLHWRKPQTVFVCSQGDLFHDDVPDEFIYRIYKQMSLAPQHVFLILTKRAGRLPKLVPRICGKLPDRLNHVWHGVSIEDQPTADDRIPHLVKLQGKLFVSIEPMLGSVDLTPEAHHSECDFTLYRAKCDCDGGCDNSEPGRAWLENLDWVVVGGESGPGARPMHPDWARKVRDDCKGQCKFMFKQWGEYEPRGSTDRPGFATMLGILTDKWIEQDGYAFLRVGKKKAGRFLDGVRHEDRPGGAG